MEIHTIATHAFGNQQPGISGKAWDALRPASSPESGRMNTILLKACMGTLPANKEAGCRG